MKQLTPNEMLDRLEWRREVRNIMGRISHDYAVKQEAEVYERYWSTREDVSLGLNNGYYQGAAAVAGYYKALGEEIKLSSELIQKMFPKELGDKTEEEVYGVGMITYLPFESQVIEIADDGQTAKGIWNIRGSGCHLTVGGPVANWIFGWAAVDFIQEEGQWKIWHMQLLYNVDHQCGSAFCDEEKVFEPVPGFEPIGDFKLPEPNVPKTLFETFYPDRPKAVSPRCPEPYETFEKTFSYGI
jgi:hypothetical protein